jgi:hypothetical protein
MKHYTTEQWADFARGLVEGNSKLLMQKHLDGGCGECAHDAKLWARVSELAKRQPAVELSEGAVRYAKAVFAGEKPQAKREQAPGLAQLLFDSFMAPATAGVRSAAMAGSRQMLFGLGDHRIDLRMEPQLDSDKVTIMGQLLDSANPSQNFGKVPVSLHLGNKLVATSETNDLGEFHLECQLPGRLQLSATLPEGQKISVSLVEPTQKELQERPYLTDYIKENSAVKERFSRSRKKN